MYLVDYCPSIAGKNAHCTRVLYTGQNRHCALAGKAHISDLAMAMWMALMSCHCAANMPSKANAPKTAIEARTSDFPVLAILHHPRGTNALLEYILINNVTITVLLKYIYSIEWDAKRLIKIIHPSIALTYWYHCIINLRSRWAMYRIVIVQNDDDPDPTCPHNQKLQWNTPTTGGGGVVLICATPLKYIS